MGMKEVDLRITKNSFFTLCFAESKECFMQVSESLIPLLGSPAQIHVRTMYFVYPCCSSTRRATTFKSPGSSTALHEKMMQTTLDDVCMVVFCSAVQNYIIFGLFRMLLQSYSIYLLGLTWQMSYMKYLQNESPKKCMIIFVFSTPKYYKLGPF